MSLLNYTTTIGVEKTVGEILYMLGRAKAQAVLIEFSDGSPTSVSFKIATANGPIAFRLPARIDNVYKVLLRDRNIPKKARSMEQASRVAWRIVKDWLAAQLAFVEAEQAEMTQLFLHCAQRQDGRTVYEVLQESNFSGLALPPSAERMEQ